MDDRSFLAWTGFKSREEFDAEFKKYVESFFEAWRNQVGDRSFRNFSDQIVYEWMKGHQARQARQRDETDFTVRAQLYDGQHDRIAQVEGRSFDIKVSLPKHLTIPDGEVCVNLIRSKKLPCAEIEFAANTAFAFPDPPLPPQIYTFVERSSGTAVASAMNLQNRYHRVASVDSGELKIVDRETRRSIVPKVIRVNGYKLLDCILEPGDWVVRDANGRHIRNIPNSRKREVIYATLGPGVAPNEQDLDLCEHVEQQMIKDANVSNGFLCAQIKGGSVEAGQVYELRWGNFLITKLQFAKLKPLHLLESKETVSIRVRFDSKDSVDLVKGDGTVSSVSVSHEERVVHLKLKPHHLHQPILITWQDGEGPGQWQAGFKIITHLTQQERLAYLGGIAKNISGVKPKGDGHVVAFAESHAFSDGHADSGNALNLAKLILFEERWKAMMELFEEAAFNRAVDSDVSDALREAVRRLVPPSPTTLEGFQSNNHRHVDYWLIFLYRFSSELSESLPIYPDYLKAALKSPPTDSLEEAGVRELLKLIPETESSKVLQTERRRRVIAILRKQRKTHPAIKPKMGHKQIAAILRITEENARKLWHDDPKRGVK